jgi:hypothetical protein
VVAIAITTLSPVTESATEPDMAYPTIREPAWSDILVDTAFELAAAAVIVCALLFFLLAGRNKFLRKLVRFTPGFRRKKALAQIARGIENQPSTYLHAFAFNNFILGCAVAGALSLLTSTVSSSGSPFVKTPASSAACDTRSTGSHKLLQRLPIWAKFRGAAARHLTAWALKPEASFA